MKKVILIAGIVLAVAAVAGGSFYGGILYQKNQADSVQARFFEGRGGQMPSEGQFFEGMQPPEGMIMPGGEGRAFATAGSGKMGQVKSIEGDTLLLSTAENVTPVKITEDTEIQITKLAELDELEPGMRVTVIGEEDEDGNLTASQIQVLDSTVTGVGLPPAIEEP